MTYAVRPMHFHMYFSSQEYEVPTVVVIFKNENEPAVYNYTTLDKYYS